MPHIIVKLWPGKSARQKAELTQAIVQNVMTVLGYGKDSVSVALEEVAPGQWIKQVYEPDIAAKRHQLTKEPGYGPGDL